MACSSVGERSTTIKRSEVRFLTSQPNFLVVCAERRRQLTLERSSAVMRQSKPVNALGGTQGHTGTSNNRLEATLMMVRETLDSRGPNLVSECKPVTSETSGVRFPPLPLLCKKLTQNWLPACEQRGFDSLIE